MQICVSVCVLVCWSRNLETHPTGRLPNATCSPWFRVALTVNIWKCIQSFKALEFTWEHNHILSPFLFAQRAFTTMFPEGTHIANTQDDPYRRIKTGICSTNEISHVLVAPKCILPPGHYSVWEMSIWDQSIIAISAKKILSLGRRRHSEIW